MGSKSVQLNKLGSNVNLHENAHASSSGGVSNDVLPPLPQRKSATNSGNKSTSVGGGGHAFRLGGLSRYLMEKAQSNDSGFDLSPATLKTLVHPLRSSNSSTSSLHVRSLFESPASGEDSPITSNDLFNNERSGGVPSTPQISRSLLSERSHNSSESTVIERTLTDETSSKDIVVKDAKVEPLTSKVYNGPEESNPIGSVVYSSSTKEKTKQYYTGNADNITPKEVGFQVPYGRRIEKSKKRFSSGHGNSENTDPYAIEVPNSRESNNHNPNNYIQNNNNGNYSSEIAAVISTGVGEHSKKTGCGTQTPLPKTKKKPVNPPSTKKQTGWKFLSEHVKDKEFLILDRLGKGGCGEVSLVMEKATRKQYALKIVPLHGVDDAAVQECINEVEMLIDLKGTDLVVDIQSWEFNRSEKTMKILMEKGQCDLNFIIQKAIKTKQPINLIKLKFIWERLLTIVDKIHSRGIVHADLKPANFVWFVDNLKIIDFGIASRLQSDLTSIAMSNPKGTLNFISPEIIQQDDSGRSKLSPKSDIWALGCILYFMVYGRAPFEHIGHTVSKMNAILQGEILYPNLPPHLHGSEVISVLKLCFQLDYKRRPSAAELLRHRFLSS